MSEQALQHEVARLRSRVADLERLLGGPDPAGPEEELRRQTSVLQSVLDGIGDGVAVTDERGSFLLFNPAAVHILRLGEDFQHVPPAEWSEKFGLFLPDQQTPYPAAELPLARAMRGEEVTAAELFMRHAHAPEGVWLSVTTRPLRDRAGRPRGGVAVFRDVTARKRADEVLRRAEEQYRVLLESTAEGVYGLDRRGRCTFLNRAAADMLGYRPEEALGRGMHKLIHHTRPDGSPYPASECPLYHAFATGRGGRLGEEVFWRRDGTPFPVECSSSPLVVGGAVQGAVVTFNDISERKKAERRQAAQHAVTRVLAEAATLGEATPRIAQAVCESVGWDVGAIWYVDRAAGVLRCSDVWHRPGLEIAEFEEATRRTTFVPGVGLPGRVWAGRRPAWVVDVTTDTNFPRAPIAARAGLHGGLAFPVLFGKEVTGVLEFFSRQMRPPDGDLLSMLAALGSQIGQFLERKRAEEELRRSRERFELAVAGSGVGIWDWDVETNQVYHSPRWKQMLGYGEDELPDVTGEWEKRLHPEDKGRAQATLQDYLEGRTPAYESEHRLLHKDGTYRWIHSRAVALRGPDGRPCRVAGAHADVTERKRAERRLAALYAVSRVLAEAAPLGEATPRLLRAVAEGGGWEVGALWRADRAAGVLRCVDVWRRPGVDVAEFEAFTRQTAFSPGVGLPGQVWARREPTWAADVERDLASPRSPVAARCGLRGAFGFPVLFDREVTGVLEFFSRHMLPPDEDLLAMAGALGEQVGQFLERQRAEEELRKSRERFELAVAGSGDGIWDWDVETDLVYYSPRWKQMLGYSEGEVAPTFEAWERLVHPEDRQRALETIRAYFRGAVPVYELEHRLRHKDGGYRWILARGVALRDAWGRPCRMAGSHTDVTARREAEERLRESEALYQSLVENLPLNVFRKDRQGRFTFGNRRFLDSLGRPAGEVLGRTDFDFYPPALAEKYRRDDARVLATGAAFEDVEEHRRADGEKIYVEVRKAPLYDGRGEPAGTQTIFWDVTARKRAQEALQQAKEAAEAANRAKSEFLANMSHEIRTPMNAVVGMTELVLDTLLTAEQRDCLEVVQKSADALLGILNDILDFSKIEAGRFELDRHDFHLRDCLGDVLSTLALRADQKGLELACRIAPDVPDRLVGDAGRLRQVLMNLLSNAIKFTDRGEVVVEVALVCGPWDATDEAPAPEDHGQRVTDVTLRFAVRDTGIGIAPDKLDQVFAPFVQADGSTTRKYGGTGLGLAIAARLVELMDGRLRVESAVGRGSTFHFAASFGVRPGAAGATPPAEAARVRGLAVLVVDDNATNRHILQETLRHWQMLPTAVDGAAAALEALRRASRAGEPFPLVLLDAHMPGMDGLALAAEVRRQPDLAGAAILMLTSADQPGDPARYRDLGVAACLTKPVRQADLWRAVLAALAGGAERGVPSAERGAPDSSRSALGARRSALRVLLAEDNPVNQKLAVRLLEKRGHAVVVADNGKAALALLGVRNQESGVRSQESEARPILTPDPWSLTPDFDVVLMDVQMPEMDGFEATAAIRRHERAAGGHLPVVAMTAYAMKGDRERCLEAGMDAYVSKPVRARELFEVIEGVLAAGGPGKGPRPAEAPAEDVLDWAAALETVAGDRDLLKDLIQVFLGECPRWADEVRAGLAQGDPARAQLAAHKLKGTLGNFGARVAFEAALQLEMLCREGDRAGAGEAWRLLEKELERLLPVLNAWTAEGGAR